ncbi:MAG: hypothetical protein NVSMB3_06310 [Acidobacteriaceae bacterium]
MAEEVEEARPVRPAPRKAIPPDRDQLQSRLLAWIVAAAILACILLGFLATGDEGGRYKVAGISIAFAILAAAVRSATVPGALAGAIACFCMTWWTRDLESPLLHSALPPLVVLVVLTFAATRAGKQQKLARGLAERSTGRSAAQVLANLGIAALSPTPIGAYVAHTAGITLPIDGLVLSAACLAALAEATADTVSSEIGQAFASRTYMLTSLRRVHRGTDGGVSLLGTLAGLAASLVVVLAGGSALRLSGTAEILVFLAGFLGLLADSLLGATLERRGWIGNDLVNLTATAVATLSLLLLTRIAGR